jgi:ABC-2 type transport system permease protein
VIRVELALMLRRRRVWLCWILLCALPTLVAILLATTRLIPPPGQSAAGFLSAVVSDGQLFPAAALALVLPVFLPITVAVVAGDTVAGEASAGMLRYLLVRPVGRLRLLIAKLISVTAFVLLAVLFVTITGYVVGIAAFGFGPDAVAGGGIASLSGSVLTPTQLFTRTLGVVGYLALCMLTLGTVGLFFSTLTDSPLAAALGVLAVVVTSAALLPLDAAAAVRTFLPTTHWLAWVDFYRDPVLWPSIVRGVEVQLGWIAVAFGAAWANFATKDITS